MVEYDVHHWHTSLFRIRGSMLRPIAIRVGLCLLWTIAIVYISKQGFPLTISDRVFEVATGFVVLLLALRTYAGYKRYWEAREQWSRYANATRNICRLCAVYFSGAPEVWRDIIGWTTLYAQASLSRLRDISELGAISASLPLKEIEAIRRTSNRPLAIAARITGIIESTRKRGVISDNVQFTFEQMVRELIDALGVCEGIHRTPFPFPWVVHLRRVLVIYLLVLPFGFLDAYGWGTVAVTALVAFAALGTEEIAAQIEDPFGQDANALPLERICASIERDLMGFMPPEAKPKSG